MVDIHLMQMMAGMGVKPPTSPNTRVKAKEQDTAKDVEWEKEIETFSEELAELAVTENNIENNMMTPEALKARLKEEFKAMLLMKDTERNLEKAIDILNEEGAYYPNPEHWAYMAIEFKDAVSQLQKEAKNPTSNPDQTLQDKAYISDGALNCVEDVAKKKYNDKDFESCRTLYTFLAIMNNKKFDFWQRLGVSHQELKEFEQAIQAYENAWMLDQEDIPNRLFVAECYFELKNKIKAEECSEAARQLIETQNEMEKWNEHLTALEQSIADIA